MMVLDFINQLPKIEVSMITLSVIIVLVIVLFFIFYKIFKHTKNKAIKNLKKDLRIPAGEIRKGCIFLDPDDLIYRDQSSTESLGSVGEWISSNFQEIQLGEIYVPFYSISVNGRFEVIGAYGNVWVEPSNPKDSYPIHIQA